MSHALLRTAFSKTAELLRKVAAKKRFNRVSASRPLLKSVHGYWSDLTGQILDGLEKAGWDKVQRHTQTGRIEAGTRTKAFQNVPGQVSLSKTISDQDRKFLHNVLGHLDLGADLEKRAQEIIWNTSFDTFNSAANFALGQLGSKVGNFELKNEAIKERLLERAETLVSATTGHIDRVFGTIIDNFYDLGSNPYDGDFVKQLREDLNYKADWEAKRFALTETGIVSEIAQVETYRKNGVQRKRWNATGDNTREDHAELSGEEVAIDKKFLVGGTNEADHPLDPNLPASELVNCHCWVSPVVSDDFKLDPQAIWRGK